MREYGVTVCSEECKICIVKSKGWWCWEEMHLLLKYWVRNYCPSCGTRIGVDKRGPWREAMVPRAALEWLAEQCDDCPDLPGHECPVAHLDNEDMPEGACYKCLCDAALKAAEEAADE